MNRRHRRSPFRSSPLSAALLCGVALLQSTAIPVLAQTAVAQGVASELTAALSGSAVPQSIKVTELDATWRSFSPNAEQSDLYVRLSHMRAPQSAAYYTRGETLRAGRETYLIAYRQTPVPVTLADMRRMMMADDDGDGVPDSRQNGDGKLRPDAVLNLSLLNLRTLGNLDDLRAFDPAKDVMTAAEAKAKATPQDTQGSVNNLRQIGLALMQYTQDYDEKLPPMRSAQSQAQMAAPPGRLVTVQQALQPYVRSTKIFSHPTTREIYRPNPALSGVNMSEIQNSARTVAFWERSPAGDGRRAVLYLDGHVRRERETEWPQILARSNRLVPPRNLMPRKRRSKMKSANELVSLSGSAALYYMYRTGVTRSGRHLQVYKSANGRIYYRDPKTHQAVWLKPPRRSLLVKAEAAQVAAGYRGYNNSRSGRSFGGDKTTARKAKTIKAKAAKAKTATGRARSKR